MGWAARHAVLLKSPISATMRLSEVNFCASAAASLGSALLSPTSITMGRPLTPPPALTHSTPRSMAFWKSCPYSAKLPVSGALSAIWMGSALHAAPAPTSSTGTAKSAPTATDLRELFIVPPRTARWTDDAVPVAGEDDQGPTGPRPLIAAPRHWASWLYHAAQRPSCVCIATAPSASVLSSTRALLFELGWSAADQLNRRR